MPGVYRPYSLADVLGTLNDQSSQGGDQGGGSVSGLGYFAEADETATIGDSATTTVQVNPGWDQGVWGAVIWT